jgi:hypothetical protein
MDTKKLLALATIVERATNMDHYFRATQLTPGASLSPTSTGIGDLHALFDAQKTPQSVPTLNFYVFEPTANGAEAEQYILWIQKYYLAPLGACQAAMAAALRLIANSGGKMVQATVDAVKFL